MNIEESKDEDNILKFQVNSSKYLVLKILSPIEYISWQNSLYQAIKNARTKKFFNVISNATTETEQEICRFNEEEVEGFFSGPEKLFSIMESREMLFEELTSQVPEMGYLCIIYDTMGKYESYCSSNQFIEAQKEAKKLHKMISNFFNTPNTTQEQKEPDLMDEDVVDVDSEISKVINEIFPKNIQKTLTALVKQKDIELDKELFKSPKNRIIAKITGIYKTIEKNKTGTVDKSKFLSIPAIQFKKTLRTLPDKDVLEKLVDTLHAAEAPRSFSLERSMTVVVMKNGLMSRTISARDPNKYAENDENMNDCILIKG
jgi:hypothetical protein